MEVVEVKTSFANKFPDNAGPNGLCLNPCMHRLILSTPTNKGEAYTGFLLFIDGFMRLWYHKIDLNIISWISNYHF